MESQFFLHISASQLDPKWFGMILCTAYWNDPKWLQSGNSYWDYYNFFGRNHQWRDFSKKPRTYKTIRCLEDLARNSGSSSWTSANLETPGSLWKPVNFSPTRRHWASRENGAIRHSILRGVSAWRRDWKTQWESWEKNKLQKKPDAPFGRL